MVDLQFKSRAKHLVPLALIKQISAASGLGEVEEDVGVGYLGEEGMRGIKGVWQSSSLTIERVKRDGGAVGL
jgi:hypothetical protein